MIAAAVASLGVTAAVVAIGVAGHSSKPTPPVSLGAPLSAVDTTKLVVARAPFCGRVPATDVTAALGAAPTAATTTAPGHPSPVRGQQADENGCTWSHGSATAAAWIFAPPVDPAWARQLTAVPHGCTLIKGTTYGSPSTAYSCRTGTPTTTLAGLFGDAWVTCTLTSTDLATVGKWCVAVARAAA